MKARSNSGQCQLSRFVVAVTAALILSKAEALAENVREQLHVEEFGVVEGKPIANGFMFVDGHYLDAPYRVDRKGLGIYVNNVLIETTPWTGEPKPVADVDPQMPPGITKDTSYYDPALRDFLVKKMLYLHKHYGKDAAVKMLDVYKSLPCYKDVKADEEDKGIVHITTFDGKTCDVSLVLHLGRQVDMHKPAVLERANAARKDYEVSLGMGECYFFFHRGGRIFVGAAGVSELLPRLIPILRSAKDEETKFKEVQGAVLKDVNQNSFAEIVTNFSASPQLEQRLTELRAQKERH